MTSFLKACALASIFVAPVSAALVSAQQELRSRPLPITAPIRHAGVYHLATGTWTRNASIANVGGPDIIYNNSCATVYFVRMRSGDVYQHRSRIPSPSGETADSLFYGTTDPNHRWDKRPGCAESYTVNAFEIGYCSSATRTVDWEEDFASSYTLCGGGDMVPQYTFLLTGLPGGGPSSQQRCWIVGVDLSGTTPAMVLSADGDGTYDPVHKNLQQFGWSLGPTNNISLSEFTGPILAGSFTWTGGPFTGPLTPCTGTDGTIWDSPINLAEEGTGMNSNNFFRMTGTNPNVPSGPGCYFFDNPLQMDFYLKLFADAQCPPPPLGSEFCFPGEGGIQACTTCSPANPPSTHGRGCNNYGQITGGAHLSGNGLAQVSIDTMMLTSGFENNTAFTVILQGIATTNVVFGAGIRCVAGNLKRLYTGPAGSAANGDPAGAFHRPGPVDTTSVHQASRNKGYDIGAHAPVTLYYLAYYRDPAASAHCASATFNATQGVSVSWTQ